MKNSLKIGAALLLIIALIAPSGCRRKGMPRNLQETFNKYIEYWNTGDFDGIEEVLDENFELLESPDYIPQTGINSFKKLISNTRTTYPDFKLEVNETVYEEDKIALIWTVTGTQLGPGEIAPTGRTIKGKGISVIHFRDGKVKDEWLGNNNLLWLIQLGFSIVPPSASENPVQ